MGHVEGHGWPVGHVDLDPLPLQELVGLHGALSDEERLELLECLLIGASIGWRQVQAVLGQWVLSHVTERDLKDLPESPYPR
jgi:hypothetical protein